MRKLYFILMMLCAFTISNAQDIVVDKLRSETSRSIKKETDTLSFNWKRGGMLSFNLSQASLSNWAAGGDNFSLAAGGYFNYYVYHTKARRSWDNNLDVNIGYVQSTSLGGRKNDDRIDLLSKYGYKMDSVGKWYISGLFNFRSQFFDGYNYNNNVGTLSSTVLAPAYILLSAGFDYKPNSKLSVFVSPLTSRWVIVAKELLAKQGLYGVDSGKNSINEVGAFATVNYNNNISKDITYKVRLDLFSNYKKSPQNIDVFMTNQFSYKINKNFNISYSLDLIYDDDVRLFGANKTSAGLQTKSLIGVNYLRPLNVKRK